MKKALSVIKEQTARIEDALQEYRLQLEVANANNPRLVLSLSQSISECSAKLDTLKHLYKILGGK